MPVGISWTRYISFIVVSLFTTLAGGQVVHMYYKPLDDLEELIQQELERKRISGETKNT
jgi:hypothetical protein